MTTLPLHPWERPSPISALNNGFRFLFILPHTVSLLSPFFSLTVTWPALIIIIAAGHHKTAAAEITKASADKIGSYLSE